MLKDPIKDIGEIPLSQIGRSAQLTYHILSCKKFNRASFHHKIALMKVEQPVKTKRSKGRLIRKKFSSSFVSVDREHSLEAIKLVCHFLML